MRRPSRKPESFSAADRLHTSFEFRRLQRKGVRAQSAHFVLYAGRFEGGDGSRLGVTVSRRIGKAVVRNRLKRRVRECFRRLLRSSIPAATSMVVIARPGAGELTMPEVSAELCAATRNIIAKLNRG